MESKRRGLAESIQVSMRVREESTFGQADERGRLPRHCGTTVTLQNVQQRGTGHCIRFGRHRDVLKWEIEISSAESSRGDIVFELRDTPL